MEKNPSPDYLLLGSSAPIVCLTFARFSDGIDCRFILSGTQDGSVLCWNLKHRRAISTLSRAHEDAVLSIAPIPNCNQDEEGVAEVVLTQGRDGFVRRWRVSRNGSQWTKEGETSCQSLYFCRFSLAIKESFRLLAFPSPTEYPEVNVCDANNASLHSLIKLTPQTENYNEKFGLIMDLIISCGTTGDIFVLGGFESGHVMLWLLVAREFGPGLVFDQVVISHGKFHNETIMSLDFCTKNNYGYSASADGLITSWTIIPEDKGRKGSRIDLKASKYLDSGIGYLRCRSDGKLLVLGTWDKEVILLGGKKLKLLGKLDLHEEAITCACFSEETKEFALGSKDKMISVWSLYAKVE